MFPKTLNSFWGVRDMTSQSPLTRAEHKQMYIVLSDISIACSLTSGEWDFGISVLPSTTYWRLYNVDVALWFDSLWLIWLIQRNSKSTLNCQDKRTHLIKLFKFKMKRSISYPTSCSVVALLSNCCTGHYWLQRCLQRLMTLSMHRLHASIVLKIGLPIF